MTDFVFVLLLMFLFCLFVCLFCFYQRDVNRKLSFFFLELTATAKHIIKISISGRLFHAAIWLLLGRVVSCLRVTYTSLQ